MTPEQKGERMDEHMKQMMEHDAAQRPAPK